MSEREKLIELAMHEICCDPSSCEAPKCGCMAPRETASAILTAYEAAGYVVVPKEPTEAMLAAVWSIRASNGGDATRACYAAMIAAGEKP